MRSHIPFNAALACCLLAAWPLQAGLDSPGSMEFSFLAETDTIYTDWAGVPETAPFDEVYSVTFFSSDASHFGDDGAFIWAGFDLMGPDGPRYGMLLMDLDLGRAPSDGETPMPRTAVRAEYLEKSGDEILFAGEVMTGEVWIIDMILHSEDKGAVEGDFAFIFADPRGEYPGCRVLMKGRFLSDPAPSELRQKWGLGPHDPDSGGEDEVVAVDCSGDVYVADDGSGCDCGGDDTSDSGCEGDSSSSDSGCEGDSSGGSGCEGDSGGGGCEGDAGGGCSGGESCSIRGPAPSRKRGGPLQALLRFFPELVALAFITWLRRRKD